MTAHDIEPPVELLHIRHQGTRITAADVARFVPTAQPKRQPGRKRGWRRTKAG